MAVMLPPELSKFLNMIGFEWPEGNEDKVFDWSQKWTSYGQEVTSIKDASVQAHDSVMQANAGPGVQAFSKNFTSEEQAGKIVKNLGTAATITGGCLIAIAMAIVALKVVFVVNLTIFAIEVASAIAAAIPTFGASMSLIPIAEIVAQRAVQYGISLGIEKLMGG